MAPRVTRLPVTITSSFTSTPPTTFISATAATIRFQTHLHRHRQQYHDASSRGPGSGSRASISRRRDVHSVAIGDDPDHGLGLRTPLAANKGEHQAGQEHGHGTFNNRSISKYAPPLSLLPLPILLRSYAITSMSSFSTLLTPSLKLISFIANSSSPLINPDQNPFVRFLLKKTFYAQFCAGETPAEVRKTSARLKQMGYQGVILAYGKEIVLQRGEKIETEPQSKTAQEDLQAEEDVRSWKEGTLQTVGMTEAGDFVALKFTGAGRDAVRQLARGGLPGPAIEAATVEICERARERGVGLLFDAEQDAVQKGIDDWTIEFQRRYNTAACAVVYGTYQAYLRATPAILAEHLAIAHQNGFKLGVKLVRGAYMSSDPRELFWDSKADTDRCYDGIVEAIVSRSWNDILQPPSPSSPALSPGNGSDSGMPTVAFVLASHNMDSVKKCMSRCESHPTSPSNPLEAKAMDIAYGQLLGMADEVGCELVMAGKHSPSPSAPKAYPYCVWGSVGECAKYLVRRAEENRDALGRARLSRMALGKEVWRRITSFGR